MLISPTHGVHVNGGLCFNSSSSVITRIVSGAASHKHALHFLCSNPRSRFGGTLCTLNRAPLPRDVVGHPMRPSSTRHFRSVFTHGRKTIATPATDLRFDHRLVGHVRVGNVSFTCVALRTNLNGFHSVSIRSLAGRGASSRRVVIGRRTMQVIGRTGSLGHRIYTMNAAIVHTVRDAIDASKRLGRCRN